MPNHDSPQTATPQLSTRGFVCDLVHVNRVMKMYAVQENELKSISSFNFDMTLWSSLCSMALAFAANAVGLMAGAFLTSQLTVRFCLDDLAGFGAVMIFVGGISMLIAALIWPITVLTILIPAILMTFGCAIVMPAAAAGALAPFPEKSGTAASLLGCTRFASAGIVSEFVGYWQGENARLLALVIVLASLAILGILLKKRRLVSQARVLDSARK